MASPPPSQPRPTGILCKTKRRMLLGGGTALGLVLMMSNIDMHKNIGIGVILISSVVVILFGRCQRKAIGEAGRLLRRQGLAMWVSRVGGWVSVLWWVVWVGAYLIGLWFSYLFWGMWCEITWFGEYLSDKMILECASYSNVAALLVSLIYLIPIFIRRW